ncbi:MAG TPA: acyl-CoA dehydrogenase family protein, partial [Acetobacteraceae bacterium]|nr:acyl-CoA dehydrogenase family protein [Acetobacteraceae bacterium]
MDFRFTSEQVLIQDNARNFLQARASSERLRSTLASETGWDEALWHAMGAELGWPGVALPEAVGGRGLGMVELAILMHETGRVLAATPFFTSAGLCAPAILAVATAAQQAALLPDLACGKTKYALCLSGARGTPAPLDLPCVLLLRGGAAMLRGVAHFVAFGHVADRLLVMARAPGSVGWDGVSLVAVPANAPGVRIERVVSLDLTRPYATVHFQGVSVATDSILGTVEAAGPAVKLALASAATMLAAEQLGGAERVLEVSVDYAKQREQFGRPIGSFQAVKHILAEMKLLVEGARAAAYYAACAMVELPDEREEAAAIARSYCSDAFCTCAGQ